LTPPHYTKRRKACSAWVGHRPVNAWGDGDLPAPYAEGDLVAVPDDSPTLTLPVWDDRGSGLFVVNSVFSIDEGDAWYVRVNPLNEPDVASGRLYEIGSRDHVICQSLTQRSDLTCELVSTADPHGLTLRQRILAEGWSPPDEWLPSYRPRRPAG
jgi:hypothetical protein